MAISGCSLRIFIFQRQHKIHGLRTCLIAGTCTEAVSLSGFTDRGYILLCAVPRFPAAGDIKGTGALIRMLLGNSQRGFASVFPVDTVGFKAVAEQITVIGGVHRDAPEALQHQGAGGSGTSKPELFHLQKPPYSFYLSLYGAPNQAGLHRYSFYFTTSVSKCQVFP